MKRAKASPRDSGWSMSGEIRLHLGCGNVHKAGFVNIDRFDSSVADVMADVARLPFASASVDGIEAFHVIEHLDLVHCRYALSEWFRVLREGAELIVETPDITRAFERFLRSDADAQERELSWIYGIDSPGMQHKVGLSLELVERLMAECGFVEVRRRDASTHLYEPGMRMVCRKPRGGSDADFASSLRHRLLAELSPVDSYVMVPLEKHVEEVLDSLREERAPTLDDVTALAAKKAAVNPAIAVAILGSWEAVPGTESDMLADAMAKVQTLRDARIHEKALALWIRARKEGSLEGQFREFTERLGRDVLSHLRGSDGGPGELAYIMDLEPERIPLLDLELVLMDARLRVNRGVKRFAAHDLDGARSEFEAAAKENPESLYAFWNLARLGVADGSVGDEVGMHYERAVSLSHGTRLQKTVEEEARSYRAGGSGAIEAAPVAE
jgi:predicted SAM-dependent methyltransferase